MKSLFASCLLAFLLTLPAPARAADDAPLVVVTLQSYNAAADALARMVDAIEPGQGAKMVAEMDKGLPLKRIEGFDPARPVQAAMWIGSFSQTPVFALHVPVKDFEAARPGIEGLLPPEKDKFSVEPQGNGYARVLFRGDKDAPAGQVAAARALPAPARPEFTLALRLRPNEDTRTQLKGVLAMARLSMDGLMKNADLPEGMDPHSYAEILGVYLDFATILIDGVQMAEGGYAVTEDAIVSDFRITPVPDSEVAGIFRNLEAQPFVMEKLSLPSAPLWMAGKIGKWDGARAMLEKMTVLGYRIMQQEADEELVKKWGDFANELLPLQYGLALDFKDRMSFSGIYRFPESVDAGALFDKMVDLTELAVKGQVGEKGIYKSFEHKKAFQTIGGVPVDRFSYAFNPESPLFAQKQTAEMMKKMYGEEVRFDMGRKGDSLLFSTPDQTGRLFSGEGMGAAPAGLTPNRDSALLISFNIISLIKSFSAMLDDSIPENTLARMKALPSEGAEITMQADVKRDARVVTRVPMALIKSLSSMESAEMVDKEMEN